MARLLWSPAALRDVQRLYRFLQPHNPDAAKRAASTIRHGVRLLRQHPQAGRPIEDMPPEFREWPIGFGAGGYVALYRVEADLVVILAIRHGREDG